METQTGVTKMDFAKMPTYELQAYANWHYSFGDMLNYQFFKNLIAERGQ